VTLQLNTGPDHSGSQLWHAGERWTAMETGMATATMTVPVAPVARVIGIDVLRKRVQRRLSAEGKSLRKTDEGWFIWQDHIATNINLEEYARKIGALASGETVSNGRSHAKVLVKH
jgi:hypothetical protein